MADAVITRYLKDQVVGQPAGLSPQYSGLWAAYMTAGDAMVARRSEVTITSTGFGGQNSSGQITGDPRELCESYQSIIDEATGDADTGLGHSLDRWTRWSRT